MKYKTPETIWRDGRGPPAISGQNFQGKGERFSTKDWDFVRRANAESLEKAMARKPLFFFFFFFGGFGGGWASNDSLGGHKVDRGPWPEGHLVRRQIFQRKDREVALRANAEKQLCGEGDGQKAMVFGNGRAITVWGG